MSIPIRPGYTSHVYEGDEAFRNPCRNKSIFQHRLRFVLRQSVQYRSPLESAIDPSFQRRCMSLHSVTENLELLKNSRLELCFDLTHDARMHLQIWHCSHCTQSTLCDERQ